MLAFCYINQSVMTIFKSNANQDKQTSKAISLPSILKITHPRTENLRFFLHVVRSHL
jgi:hypothetical protein